MFCRGLFIRVRQKRSIVLSTVLLGFSPEVQEFGMSTCITKVSRRITKLKFMVTNRPLVIRLLLLKVISSVCVFVLFCLLISSGSFVFVKFIIFFWKIQKYLNWNIKLHWRLNELQHSLLSLEYMWNGSKKVTIDGIRFTNTEGFWVHNFGLGVTLP